MSIIDDCTQFLEDLILGDFNEQQMVSAQIIGGLISLIPVMDQVMDARDVSGTLYRINKHGGFGKATLEQKIDFGFAAFGVVPEVGSAFKTVFKPLYKQRKAAKGVINGGVAMIERMLGQKKGGAVRWVRALDWAGNTQAAIVQANLALDSCIAMLAYLGQPHWWCPDRLEQLARDVAPGLQAMRGKLEAPIREAAAEIRKFLEDMLGEHAAAVALAVANNAAVVRPGRTKTTSQKSEVGRRVSAHEQLGGQARVQGKKSQGKIASTVQRTAWDSYKALGRAMQGLLGEHIVEHHVIEQKNWGLQWNCHDMAAPRRGQAKGGWQSEYRKLNDMEIPTYLCMPSTKVFAPGIDSLWITNRAKPNQYAVVEAKASMSLTKELHELLGEAQRGAGGENNSVKPKGGRNRNQTAKKPTAKEIVREEIPMVMQMSREWIWSRIVKNHSSHANRFRFNYSRHVFLVTPLQASEHLQALEKIVEENLIAKPKEAQKYANIHSKHDVQKEFGDEDLDRAEKIFRKQGSFHGNQNKSR